MTKTLTEQWRDDPDEILSPDEEVIHEQNKIIERLQAQLREANEIISIYRIYDDTECGKATEYCRKWGVK